MTAIPTSGASKIAASVPEHELLGVDERPAEVFKPGAGVGGDVLARRVALRGRGRAGERGEVELLDHGVDRLLRLREGRNPPAVAPQLVVQVAAVDHLQRLEER